MRHEALCWTVLVASACAAAPDPAPTAHVTATSISRTALEADVHRVRVDAATPIAHLEGRNVLETMLARSAARDIWLLFGLDSATGRERLVLTPLDASGDYDFSSPCPNTCPPDESALTAPGAQLQQLPDGAIPAIGHEIDHAIAREFVAAYRAAAPGEVAGVRIARGALAALLADIRVDGLWFFVGRRASGDRSITVVRADALGATIPVNAEPAFDANPRASAALPLGQPNLGEAFLGYSSDETCTSATCPDL